MRPNKSVTVLVTGASGFLGSTLLKQLDEQCPEVQKIIAVDIRPLPTGFYLRKCKLDFHETDIRDLDQLNKIFKSVDVVIHTAAVIELGLEPNLKLLQEVNIDGTKNVIKACENCRVASLIFTSTSEMGRSFAPVINYSEEDIDITEMSANRDLLNGYSSSKRIGEKQVLQFGSVKASNNNNNSCSVALRPVGIYGEGDTKFLPTFIHCGKKFLNMMPHLGSKNAKIQRVYIGNVAWAHICAMRALLGPNRDEVTNQSYLITDDTPLTSNFTFVKPFLEAQGVWFINVSLPLWIVFYFWFLLELFIFLIRPIVKMSLPFTKEELHFACTTAYYNGAKIQSHLGYKPRFSPEQSFKRSYTYYAQLKL